MMKKVRKMRKFNYFYGKIEVKRKGFTLIEVIVALAILAIAVLALEASYFSYYRNVTDLRIKTIGQNLGQLQVEDIQNLSVSVLDSLVGGGSWPSSIVYTTPNYPVDTDPDPSVYDSGKIDGAFRIEHLVNICGTEDSATLPSLLLPNSIEVKPVLETDPVTGDTYYDYTLILHKEVFPKYKKQIVITDKTPDLDDAHKIFGIEVTVYWNVGGTEKHITVTGEKSYARSSG